MLRSRDFLAALALVWLTFSARDVDDVTATVQLSFYAPHGMKDNPTVHPVVFDVDGDGKAETLAMWAPEWKLQVLDLRHVNRMKSSQTAFIPAILLESPPILPPETSENAKGEEGEELVVFEPVAMTSGQLLTKDLTPNHQKQHTKPPSDKTLQYFCGIDWHDASHKCAVHCPSGQSSDCPNNERCYADTPCRADMASSKEESSWIFQSANSYHATPAGGWPSIFTVWSVGNVTLHSVTGEQKQGNKQDEELELRMLWNVAPLVPTHYTMEWEDVAVTMVETNSETSTAGLVIITGSASAIPYKQVDLETADEFEYVWGTFTLALDAVTGKTEWTIFAAAALEHALYPKEDEALPLPAVAPRGSTSLARRRSLTAGLLSRESSERTKNCWSEFRRSVLTTALPYQYWGANQDTKISALHFDHQGTNTTDKRGKKHHARDSKKNKKKSWFENKKHQKKHHLQFGRPNVVVTQNHQGIHVIALKNGKSICHLSLRPHTLYTDLNHDGTLDSVQIVTGEQEGMHDDDEAKRERQWMEDLARRVHAGKEEEALNATAAAALSNPLCHIMVLAGVPAKEELFSAPLCGDYIRDYRVEGAPLLVLQHGKRQDIVASVNTGEISRWTSSGNRVWHWQYGFDTWNDPSLVLLDRIHAPSVVASARPIVWAGEESVAIVSAKTGEILSATPFPQASELRPQLMDFNGDGVSDIVVVTSDGVWGFLVVVDTTGSVFFHIALGLLLMGLMLALLRNQMGPQPGKRSTDR